MKNNTFQLYGMVLAVLMLTVPYFILQTNSISQLPQAQSLCPSKMLTGFPCPGCGITKSIVFLYDGQFQKAFEFHVLGPFVVLWSIVALFLFPLEIITQKKRWSSWFFNRKIAYATAFILGVYHLIRLVWFCQSHTWQQIFQESIWV